MTVDNVQTALKQVMRVYPQGVAVLTTTASDGPKGITVSSFISVSLEPSLILVSIAKSSSLHSLFVAANAFAVNFLAEDQKSISDRFAGRIEPGKKEKEKKNGNHRRDRFTGLNFRAGSLGSPVIDGVRAVIECKRWRVYEGGDHSIIVGEVINAAILSNRKPLIYYTQQYTTTYPGESAAPPSDFVW